MGAKLHKKYVLPKSFLVKICRFTKIYFRDLCRITKIFLAKICRITKIFAVKVWSSMSFIFSVIKDLSFHINKEKAARISFENILAALYDSLKKLYFLS